MILRSLMKSAAAYAVSLTRLDRLARLNRQRRVPFVICYHRVVETLNAHDGVALPAMEISVSMLERHMDWLGKHFRIVSVGDLAAEIENPTSSLPLAAVTFDDGYSDIYHYALPLLKRKGIPAAIFAVTDLIGSAELPVHERLHAVLVRAWSRWISPRTDLADRLRRRDIEPWVTEQLPRVVQDPFSASRFLLQNLSHAELGGLLEGLHVDGFGGHTFPVALHPLNWDMLAEMRDAGMTIASHSKTHPFLTNESPERVLDETASSRHELERRLGVEVRAFAYPGGFFNPTVVDAVAAAGYTHAFTVCNHRDPGNPLLTIPRTGLWERSCLDPLGRFSPSIMRGQAAGTFNWIPKCRQTHASDGARRGMRAAFATSASA